MRGQITERIPSIVPSDLFARGRPRQEPVVIRSDIAGVTVEVEMTALMDRVECLFRRRLGRSADQVRSSVPVSWTFPNYGGRRAWLHCGRPLCNRRVGRLFLVSGPYLLCRSCARVRYASKFQAKPNYAQKLERAKAIRARLGGPPIVGARFPPRPRGMHRATYERLRGEVVELERAEDERINHAVLSGELSLKEVLLEALERELHPDEWREPEPGGADSDLRT